MKERDRLRLALETGFSTKTVSNWQSGKRVNESTHRSLSDACEKLGIVVEQKDEVIANG